MIYYLGALGVLGVHLAFVAFVVLGAVLAFRWKRVVFFQVPAAAWGVLVECADWICPLTRLENHLFARAGQQGFSGGFVDHYLLAALYPEGLTYHAQLVLAGLVILVNLALYAGLARRWRSPKGR
jgi:hypothetical protein